jgi:hypothetical protein
MNIQNAYKSVLRKCERCGRYKRGLYNVNGMIICSNCIRKIAFYKVFSEGFKDPSMRGDVITVGLDLGNMTWLNPFAQAWYYPILLWVFYKDYNIKFKLSDLKLKWRYKTPLEQVLKFYIEEKIFRIVVEENEELIVEGDALKEMLDKYGDMPDALDIIGSWISGLIISRVRAEAETPDFRVINAIVDALSKYIDPDGNIKAIPYSKVVGYRCNLCGYLIPSKDEAKKHVSLSHRIPSDEVMNYLREESISIGYLVKLSVIDQSLRKEGVQPERFVERIEKFGVLVHEDPEEPRIVDRDGIRYVVVHPAWFRVLTRTRMYERDLIRNRARG